jgi:hypothetical protein
VLDDDQVLDEATRALNHLLGRLETGEAATDARELLAMHGAACRNGSLLLALAERFAPRDRFLAAAVACARRATAVRSRPERALDEALALADACVRGESSLPWRGASLAHATLSPAVAGIDDDVGLAVTEACELCAGDPFELSVTDPASRAASASGGRRAQPPGNRAAIDRATRDAQAELADVVRAHVSFG